MYEEYPEGIQKQLKSMDEYKEAVIKSTPVFITALDCVDTFPDLQIYPVIDIIGDVEIQINYVKSIKDIVCVLKWLGKQGYRQNRITPSIDNPEMNSRRYFYNIQDRDHKQLLVRIAFTEENAKCKYIKVGEKTVDVFELKCEEEETNEHKN